MMAAFFSEKNGDSSATKDVSLHFFYGNISVFPGRQSITKCTWATFMYKTLPTGQAQKFSKMGA